MRQGYKQTEIGIIPEEWDLISFENCFSVLPNNTLSRAELNYNSGELKNIHYGDILVKFSAVTNCGAEQLPYVNSELVKKVSRGFLHDGDIVITDTAEDDTVGKATEVVATSGNKVVSGLHTIPCRPKDNKMFVPMWLGYFINHNTYHDQLLPYITGIKVSSISKTAIAGTMIAVPKPDEQMKIITVLSDADTLITSLEKLIAKKKAIKQGAMQELLTGKRRLPGFNGEWGNVVIGENGYLLHGSINPQDMPLSVFSEYSMLAFDVGKKPNRVTGANMHSNRTVIFGNVLLFNKLNVRQKRIWLVYASEKNAVCSSEFLPYCSDAISLRFLAHVLGTEDVTAYFIGSSTGTSNSQKRITPAVFLEYSLYAPLEISEQNAIAGVLDDMDRELVHLEQKLQKYQNIKSGMMSELLTGRIRLV